MPGGIGSLPWAAPGGPWPGPSYRPGPPGLATTATGCFSAPPAVFAGVAGCKLIGTTATGSPPNGFSLMTAQSTKMPRKSASVPAIICGIGRRMEARRCFLCWPSGALKSSDRHRPFLAATAPNRGKSRTKSITRGQRPAAQAVLRLASSGKKTGRHVAAPERIGMSRLPSSARRPLDLAGKPHWSSSRAGDRSLP